MVNQKNQQPKSKKRGSKRCYNCDAIELQLKMRYEVVREVIKL